MLPSLGSKNVHLLYRLRSNNSPSPKAGLLYDSNYINGDTFFLSGWTAPASWVCSLVYHSFQLQTLWGLTFQRLASNNLAEKRFGIYRTSKSLLGERF